MSRFLIFLYHYFSKKRILFYLLTGAIFLVSLFFASKIRLEEDITKFIPKSREIDKFNYVLQNFNIKDKLIVSIHYTKKETGNNPDTLQKYVDIFTTLLDTNCKGYIKELRYKISNENITELYSGFYADLPLFLNENDYQRIDSMISEKQVSKIMHSDYLLLQSPASSAVKNFLVKDPLGITYLALNKLNKFRIEENYDLYNDYIVSRDKENFLLFITSAFPSNETSKNTALIKGIDKSIENLNVLKPGLTVNYYGSIAVGVSNATQLRADTILTVIVAIVFIFFFLTFFFRNKSVPFIIILPVIFGITFSLALLYLLKTNVSIIALGAGSIIFGIAVNYSLHVFAHYKHSSSVEDVIKELTFPLTLGSFTTIGAFFCLLFVKSEALKDFGLFSAFSLIGAILFSLIALPHFLRPSDKKEKNDQDWLSNSIDKISNYRADKNKYLVGLIFILTVIFIFFSGKVKFDSDLSHINFQNKKLTRSEEYFNKTNNKSIQSVYLISTGKNLEQALAVNEKLNLDLIKIRKADNSFKFQNTCDLLLSDSLQKHRIRMWNDFWTTDKKIRLKRYIQQSAVQYKFKKDAFEQFFSLIDKDFKTVDAGLLYEKNKFLLENWITPSSDLTMIATVIKIKPENKNLFFSKFPDSGDVVVFDKSKLATRFIDVISSDFNLILVLSSLLVFISLLVTYGRIELALITFIPMLISWIWILGLMGIFGIRFNIINIIISTFIFGLGDDFSIFIMDGLTQEYKKGIKVLPSYKTAIFLSDITMMVGIGVLIFAGHPALKSIALITIIGLFSVLVIGYTIEPLLFNILIGNRKQRGWPPVTFTNILTSSFVYIVFSAACILGTIFGFLLLRILPIPSKHKKFIFHSLSRYLCAALFLVLPNVRKKTIKPNGENLKKPAIIVCNHQSHIDIPLMITYKTKLVILTNDWVQKNIFYGWIVKYADFYPVSAGIENSIAFLKKKVNQGYSILVFPEGTRSETGKIRRFHNGAMYLAEKLQLDILPVLLHGTGDCMTKKDDLVIKNGRITVKILERIKFESINSDLHYQTKKLQELMREEYKKLKSEKETPSYFKNKLIKNYIYKGPVLEWYVKIKLLLENNYNIFNEIIPENASITDIGCGYGYISYMLGMCSENRKILAIDYDTDKITIAKNCFSINPRIQFIHADISTFEFEKCDVFLISDILHYLPETIQKTLLNKCVDMLNEGGMIILRDADKQANSKHLLTRYTEFFSTKSGFNKKKNGNLCFFSSQELHSYLSEKSIDIKLLEKSRFSSNSIYVITKKTQEDAAL